MSFIVNNSIKIHYRTAGVRSKPCVVLLHGFFGCIEDWYEYGYVDTLKDMYFLIMIDSRGHGKSDKPHTREHYSFEKRCADVIAVMDKEKIEHAHVLGYSMGGRIALNLMKWHVDRFDTFIFLSVHPFAVSLASLGDAVKTMEEWVPEMAISDAAKARFLANDREALLAMTAIDPTDNSETLKNTRQKCLMLVGELEPIKEKIENAARLSPSIQLAVIPGADHMGALKKSLLVMDYVKQLLNLKVYFDTNAINDLYDKYTQTQLDQIHQYISRNNISFYISTTNIWEIKLTRNNDERKKLLLDFCIQYFNDNLLKTPMELIIDSMKLKFPKEQCIYPFSSTFSKTDILNIEYPSDLQKFHMLSETFKKRYKLLKQIISSDISDKSNSENDSLVTLINETYSKIFQTRVLKNSPEEKIYKIVIFLIYFYLCENNDPNFSFGNQNGESPKETLVKLSINYPELFVNDGPVFQIAQTIYPQIQNSPNRGIIHDGLHSVFLPFIDFFITADNGFLTIRKNSHFPNCNKIITLEELFEKLHLFTPPPSS